ncbi:MAG: DMT family transporter [Bacteroidales bacterium]|nr:DMT family transporter [Bacteroidales bacterium]
MKKENTGAWVYVLILFAMFFWGVAFVFTSVVLKYMDPFTILFIRLLISAILLWSVVLLFYRKYRIRIKDFKILVLLAFFEPFLYFIGETFGLQRVSPVITSLIISTIPVFTAITVFFVYNVSLQKINVLGIVLSFLGVVFMIVGKEMVFIVDPLGLLFLFLAVFSAVCYGLVLTKLSSRIHILWIIAAQNTFSLFMFLPLLLFFGHPINYDIQPVYAFMTPSVELWSSLIMLAIFGSTLAFLFYTIGVKHIGITRTSIFTNLIPIFTAVASLLLLHEQMTINKILGMFVIITGVVLTQWKKKKVKVATITN